MGDAVPNSLRRSPEQRERIARNFAEKYGAEALVWLIDAFASCTSGQVIADRFHVSRERVTQWRSVFGLVVTEYRVHADVRSIADEAGLDLLEGGGRDDDQEGRGT